MRIKLRRRALHALFAASLCTLLVAAGIAYLTSRPKNTGWLATLLTFALALLCLLSGVPAGQRAAAAMPEIPQTAHSASLLTPSVLLADPVNVYVFPQLTPLAGPALRAFGASGKRFVG